MRLEEAKKLYENEWIAFKKNENGENPDGDVLLHNKNRRTFDKELLKLKPAKVYVTFAGPPVPEGYTIITRLLYNII
jgi:hypothetical protein